jgi:hypothetical protein
MKTNSIAVILGCAAALSVGCASEEPTADEPTTGDDQNVTSILSPEALAKLLGTNDALNHLGQFIDPRPDHGTAVVEGIGECCTAAFVGHGNVNLNEFKTMIEHGRLAVTEKLPIQASEPVMTKTDLGPKCISKFGVYVRPGKAGFLQQYTNQEIELVHPETQEELTSGARGNFTAAVKTALEKTTVEVIIAPLDGDANPLPLGHDAPRVLRLAFAVVKRPLSNAPNAPVNGFWTILGAEMGMGRCEF